MGLVSDIKTFLKVVYRYRPYFKNKDRSMVYFAKFEVDIDEDITDIYSLIKKQGSKYKKDIALYDSYSSKIKEHNDEIEHISKKVDEWDLHKLLDDPYSFGDSLFEDYVDCAAKLKKYSRLSDECLLFLKEISIVKKGYKEICFQFDYVEEYNATIDLSLYNYVKISDKHLILDRVSEILEKLNRKDEECFYDFTRHSNLDEEIEKHNDAYLSSILDNPIFENVNGHSLDEEQRKAILTDEDSVLVVAGAGSGKTLTICGKVLYLLKEKSVKPEDILLLSYSKKSADDLQEKISAINPNLKVGTFHKIGLDILKTARQKVFTVEEQYNAIIESFFRDEMSKRPDICQKILLYYALYLSGDKNEKKYENQGELFSELKKSDYKTLKDQLVNLSGGVNSKETIKKELVKSYEELAIANWYFINGVDYVYEAPYKINVSDLLHRQYTPDFKLKNDTYHEHYGIDKDGGASQYNDEEEQNYLDTITWKRALHTKHRTDCIETYSYEFKDGTIFGKLEKELRKRGIELHPLTEKQIIDALNSVYDNRSFKSFINLVKEFLNLYKASYQDDIAFEDMKNGFFRNAYEKRRTELFLDIVKEVYRYYMNYIHQEDKIDFDDMILCSLNELQSLDEYKYKYIIVDEFQDISLSRMKFLKGLINHGSSKLFAVGDDWQSIYRFSGCDLNIFLYFEDYFGESAIRKITTTHRNSQDLQDIAGQFIKKNPEQFDKVVRSKKRLENPIQLMYFQDEKYKAFLKILKYIAMINPSANVLILGRNNRDFEDIELDNKIYIDYAASTETKTVVRCSYFPKMSLTYSTVHGSKGLEEDYVVLINAEDANIGFPNKLEDDELLDLVLSGKSEYPFAEERRLWYVALTRTRNYTYILVDSDRPSIFVEEIKNKCFIVNMDEYIENNNNPIYCPRCTSGRLVLRINRLDNSEFYGCSNHPYCGYSINNTDDVINNIRCKRCNDFMILKKGYNGWFYGCHSYPECTYTMDYPRKRNK